MIIGSFDRGRPQVECRLVIPRLRVNHRLILLVDTGASATCLHPADAIRAGIQFEQLGNRIDYLGIGGTSAYFREAASFPFEDETYLRIYRLDILIAAPTENSRGSPSLLGRDTLSRWRIDYHPTDGKSEWTGHDADRTLERI